jgi:transglutaminase-like putative cysteine protease
MKRIVRIIFFSGLALLGGLPIYALPATLSLPRGRRPGLAALTIPQAAQQLKASGKSGRALVEAARTLVADRMVYCRRNSFDIYWRAFERGYGYCQQQAYALADLLTRLGFEARVVGALRNRFPDGRVTGHAWVRVILDEQAHDIDSIAYNRQAGQIDFTPLTRVFAYTPVFRIIAGWGSIAVNAQRYYKTGKDH